MSRVDVWVTGPDVAEAAALLKIPSLGTNRWGWTDQIEAAANLRKLRIAHLAKDLGLDVTVTLAPHAG